MNAPVSAMISPYASAGALNQSRSTITKLPIISQKATLDSDMSAIAPTTMAQFASGSATSNSNQAKSSVVAALSSALP